MKTNILQSLINNIPSNSNIKNIDTIKNKFSEQTNLTTMLKDKNVQSVLKDLLSDLVNQNKSTKVVLDILKNEPLFKEFKSFSQELKSLLNILEKSDAKSEAVLKLKNQIVDIKNIDDKILKESIGKSGVFLESYLKNLSSKLNDVEQKNNLKQNILNDIKSILLQISEENSGDKESEVSKQTAKLLNQIDYYQLLSATNYSNHTYLPFSWEQLEDGNINFDQEDENHFSCQIYLELKYYGDVKINMLFDKPNILSMSFFLEQKNLKEKIQEELKTLRIGLNNLNLKIKDIFIFDLIKDKNSSKEIQAFNNYTNNIGIDIKA